MPLGRCGSMKGFWGGKKILVTGHTGFKGSWLSLWLHSLGAQVVGYSLEPPTKPNIFETINFNKDIISIIGDVRDRKKLTNVIEDYSPEIVFHLAAQPIVRESYVNPIETLEINIIGTANLLNIIKDSKSVKVVVNVTSDKCYENKETYQGYKETDPMGGYDPYSCSKGCSELITSSFRRSFLNERGIQLASARAGNVIGGGDWAEDRLVPDIIKSLSKNIAPIIRNPYAVRPWQHVLEPLNGYMMLAEKLYNDKEKYAEAWNFGPDDENIITVADLINRLKEEWGAKDKTYKLDVANNPHEAQILKLDCKKAKLKLGWHPTLSIEDTIAWTVHWYKEYYNNLNMKQFTLKQIRDFENLGSKAATYK